MACSCESNLLGPICRFKAHDRLHRAVDRPGTLRFPLQTFLLRPSFMLRSCPIRTLLICLLSTGAGCGAPDASSSRVQSTMNTPAVTIVAAWIKAETGVGPSIASGNHVCKPNCADFPIAPINNKKHKVSIVGRLNPRKLKL